jgi:catechol 2,3-dioxygenase-like lactoylglutathione lyase family enzyme
MTTSLGSILLGSSDPDRLRAWYCAAFEVEPNDHGFLVIGDVAVLVDGRADVAAKTPEPGRVILNFHVDDVEAIAAKLDSLGTTWLVRPERRESGIFATLTDPDGNYLQIIQLSPEYLSSTGAPILPEYVTDRPYSGLSVDDVPAARRFYADTLGLTVTEANGMLQLRLGAGVMVLVYPKADHAPAAYTVLNLPVADIDQAVDLLVSRGVRFERYEGSPQDEKGVMRGRSIGMGPDIAWFRDPAGNVLSILQTA